MANSEKKKQAVLLIHGVGEQIPMDTLRGFVDAVWTTDESLRRPNVPSTVWSKPDGITEDFELRRLTTATAYDGRRTDFYEYYWAHLVQGTKLSHIWSWLRLLLFRSPARVPKQLQPVWWILIVGGLLVLGMFLAWKNKWIPGAGWASLVGTAIWALIGSAVVNVAGDAARYLHITPPNIATRRDIRDVGIKILQKLHTCGEYDRIIVVGHSLGSVVGYEVLTHVWARFNTARNGVASPAYLAALETAEEHARKAWHGQLNLADYQLAQSALFKEMKAWGNGWLVTDFVTMGSPLAHAPVLMARNERELARKKNEREFPTCPPTLEESVEDGLTLRKFSYGPKTAPVPHHAAVFAVTRWTNLYFPCRGTFCGDLIGGPVAPAFGPGVRDIPVETTLQWGIFTHTKYWDFDPNQPKYPGPEWIQRVREAVRICEPQP